MSTPVTTRRLIARLGQPFQVTVRTTPYTARERLVADLGVYVQDTWTHKRLTANVGLSFDYLNNRVDAQDAKGGTWIGPRHFDALSKVPLYKDLDPRLGVAYDLFGNGKTALKATVSRYIVPSTVATARLLNPLNTTVNTTTRPWQDINGDLIPQSTTGCAFPSVGCELGALTNNAFGSVNVSTHYADDTIHGYGERRNNWEFSTSITQELFARVSADVVYYRRMQGNFTTTDNNDVTPADFTQYCVKAPVDARLPGGGGQQVCGLYDISAAKFGVATNNTVAHVENVGGTQHETFDGVDVAINARLADVTLTGGFATGNTSFDTCGVYVDNPAATYGLGAAANTPGTGTVFCTAKPDELVDAGEADRVVRAAVAGDTARCGRPESAGPADSCELVDHPSRRRRDRHAWPAAVRRRQHLAYGAPDRARHHVHAASTQVDLRLGKTFKAGGSRRVQGMVDIFNLTNSNAAVGATSNAGEPPAAINTTFGGAWLKPLNILRQGLQIRRAVQLSPASGPAEHSGSLAFQRACAERGDSTLGQRRRNRKRSPIVPAQNCRVGPATDEEKVTE